MANLRKGTPEEPTTVLPLYISIQHIDKKSIVKSLNNSYNLVGPPSERSEESRITVKADSSSPTAPQNDNNALPPLPCPLPQGERKQSKTRLPRFARKDKTKKAKEFFPSPFLISIFFNLVQLENAQKLRTQELALDKADEEENRRRTLCGTSRIFRRVQRSIKPITAFAS